MKFEVILASVLLSGLTTSPPINKKHDLEIDIANIKNKKGAIEIGIFNKADGFLIEGKEYKSKILKVEGYIVHCEFKDLPDGNYAVAVFHDENMDKKLNTNLFGIPTEPYGFSNNFKPVVSKPNFRDTQFGLHSDKKITIELIN
jgi:uncharacterized protein (DUF2141 family)